MNFLAPLWSGGLADRRKQASGDPGREGGSERSRNGARISTGSPLGLLELRLIAAAGLQ
jgi:hypothetical protein